MGGFLTVAGVVDVAQSDVEGCLRTYAKSHGGRFARDRTGLVFPDGIVITPGKPGRFSIMYPSFTGAEELTRHLSKTLNKPTFLFHIHDGDFWLYSLFVGGRKADHFNPIPDYWSDQISAAERRRCSGNARKVARHWPDLEPAAIQRYLVTWDLDATDPGKAYADDVYTYNDASQLSDFMRRLGLTFPIDEDDNPAGNVYWFDLP